MAKVVKRKILVEVGYHDFMFDDLCAANAFAVIAKSHLSNEYAGRVVRLTADYVFTEKQDEEDIEDEQDEEDIEDEQDDQTTD